MLYVIMSVYCNDIPQQVKIAVDSILNQTHTNLKLHMKCDGSISKDLHDYLNSIGDSRFVLTERQENKGLAVSLNELLEKVLPEEDCLYIARMDADDYSVPERMEKQIDFLDAHPEVDVVGSYITESSEPTLPAGNTVVYPTDHEGCRNIFGKRNPLAHPSVMFRRSFFDKAGLYPTDTLRFEDGGLWLKGFKAGCQFANIPEVLLRMRVNEDFYKRRNSPEKTKLDLNYRKQVIRELELSRSNYIYAYARYYLFRYASPSLLRWAYRHLRK